MRNTMLCLFLVMGTLVSAQEFDFSARVDTQQIKIGEPIHLNLKASIPSGKNYTWPSLNELPGISIIEMGSVDSLKNELGLELEQKVRLTSFDSGDVFIPPLKLVLEDSSISETDSIAIRVFFPNIKAGQDYYDIKGPGSIPFDLMQILYWALALLGIGLIVFFLWKRLRNKGESQAKTPEAPLVPPVEWALEALRSLEAKKLWQEGKNKAYYSELVDILRIFLERKHGLKTKELTAEELVSRMKPIVKNEQLYRQMKESLLLSALVKFAREKPLPEDNIQALESIREFVKSHQIQNPEADV